MNTPDTRPPKPTPDFPLFAHGNGQWAKKVKGKLRYYGPWVDPQAALEKYQAEAKQSISSAKASAKPADDFPLYRHKSGQWAKKISGKVHYFGTNPEAALVKYNAWRTGTPAQPTEGMTVKELVNHFLYSKEEAVKSGEIKQRTWDDYDTVCGRMIDAFGKDTSVTSLTPADFERFRRRLAKSRGPVALGNDINRVKIVLKYGYDQGYLDRPMRYGQGFNKPSRKTLRQERAKREQNNGLLMFSPAGLHAMLEKATKPMKAMILLGINCGFGNTDVALLPFSAVKDGWVNYPRPKTGIARRIPLWPETVQAIQDAIANRPKGKKDLADRIFVTSKGGTWERNGDDNPVSKEMAKLLTTVKIKRPGLNFYSLRRTFETVGGESKDQVAVDTIMGHAPDSDDMASRYRQTVSDERLQAVVDHIHGWLFNNTPSLVSPVSPVSSVPSADLTETNQGQPV
jgi:integrase